MLDENKKVLVRNKTHGSVVYTLPELHIVREFMPNGALEVPISELKALMYRKGGRLTLENYLTIEDKEVVDELIGKVEPEYFYTQADIRQILTTGTIDQLEDFLNFAPQGSIDAMKDMAMSIKLNDMSKRQLIKDKLDFDITKALDLLDASNIEEKVPEKTRKAAPLKEEANEEKTETTTERKYNVVN